MPGVSCIRPIACCWIRLRVVDVVAANLEREARVLAAAENLIELEIAAAGVGAHDDAGHARQPPAQVLRDLVARARALVTWHELDLHLPRFVLPPPPKPPPPPPPLDDDGRRFGHGLLHHALRAAASPLR